MQFSTQYDDSQARAMLAVLGDTAPTVCEKVLAQAAEWTIAHAQEHYLNGTGDNSAILRSRTGALSSSIRWWRNAPLSVLVGTGLIYAAIHEFGGIIKAVRAKYLRFRIGMEWIQVKQVQMPARPYLGPSIEALWREGALQRLAEAEMQRQAQAAQGAAG